MTLMGGDPEFHLVNRRSGKAISSHQIAEIIEPQVYHGGNANGPSKTKLKRDGSAIEMEFGPGNCRDFIVPHMQFCFVKFGAALAERGFTFDKWKLTGNATVELTKSTVQGAPDDVTVFGCNPDQNIYFGEQSPTMPDGHMFRYNGGHLHIDVPKIRKDTGKKDAYGYPVYESIMWDLEKVVRAFDVFLAIPLVALLGEEHKESETHRRLFYGKAGSYRPKDYGLEYRTLSSMAFLNSPILNAAVMGDARSLLRIPNMVTKIDQFDDVDVISIVNTHDVEAAKALMSRLADFYKSYGSSYMKGRLVDIAVGQPNFRTVDDILFNWHAVPGNKKTKTCQNHHWLGVETAFAWGNRETGMQGTAGKYSERGTVVTDHPYDETVEALVGLKG